MGKARSPASCPSISGMEVAREGGRPSASLERFTDIPFFSSFPLLLSRFFLSPAVPSVFEGSPYNQGRTKFFIRQTWIRQVFFQALSPPVLNLLFHLHFFSFFLLFSCTVGEHKSTAEWARKVLNKGKEKQYEEKHEETISREQVSRTTP